MADEHVRQSIEKPEEARQNLPEETARSVSESGGEAFREARDYDAEDYEDLNGDGEAGPFEEEISRHADGTLTDEESRKIRSEVDEVLGDEEKTGGKFAKNLSGKLKLPEVKTPKFRLPKRKRGGNSSEEETSSAGFSGQNAAESDMRPEQPQERKRTDGTASSGRSAVRHADASEHERMRTKPGPRAEAVFHAFDIVKNVNRRMPWGRIAANRKAQKAEERAREIERDAIVLTPVDASRGLSEKQVDDRRKLGLVNISSDNQARTTKQIVLSHLITYFNILNLLLGVLVFTTGEYKNMLFLGVIVSNTVIGVVQELKVKQLIDKLSVITAAKADVLRNGKKVTVATSEIVRDDVVFVSIGSQIVTDGRVLTSNGLEVNESMLTGESKPVKKRAGDELLSGSFIVAGDGAMLSEKVGDACYAQTLVAKTKKRHRASSEMQNTIQKIIKVVSVLIIPLGLLLYRSQRAAAEASALANGYDAQWVYSQSIIYTVSGVIGMIPEGLVLLTSVSFIIGVGRLAYKHALVQEMEAIEALARTNILCTDKTGTITTGKLEVSRLVAVGKVKAETIRTVMAHMNASFTDSNETQEALDAYFGKRGGWKVADAIPFSSERKYKAVRFETQGSYVVGAPEFLVPDNKRVLDFVAGYAEKGYRCLLLCLSSGISSLGDSKGALTPLSVIILSDIIKEDARDTFEYFAQAGVQVKVISGDNPATVSAVAVKAGVQGGEKYVDAQTLPTNPVRLAQEITKYNVFGRVRPEQKQAFVHAWQANGNTVAMVGDGVNDVLAIKDADCGIAMARGSEAAKQAAHIVLMDSDFSSMKDIVQEGKTIICNIERVSALYLTKTIYSAILTLIFSIIAQSYPWTTLQMGLINVIGIGMPSFLLTLEQHEDWKAKGFLPHVLKVCLPAAFTMVLTVLMVTVMSGIFGWSADLKGYFYVTLGGIVALLVVAEVCWPLNGYRKFVLLASIVVFFAGILILPGFYDIHSLWTPWTFLMVPLAVLISMFVYWISRKTNILAEQYEAHQKGG